MNFLRRLTRMVFRRDALRIFSFSGTSVDYQGKVGDGTGSSTVMAPLNWAARTFPEAPPALWRQMEESEQEERVKDHPVLRLLRRPNPFYTGRLLWMATVIDWMVDGNAYWLKLRDEVGIPKDLWWIPSWLLEPKGKQDDPSVYIDHYLYKPDGAEQYRIDPADVVHFRNGLDPDNDRLGRSQLKSVLREVYTDDEAAAFTAALLRNMGVPGVIVSPERGSSISETDAEYTKAYIKERFSGDSRGEPMVMSGATQIEQFGFSPEQLLLKELRRIPEERVTAVLGIPAIVAGLGAGLDRSTFTNMAEAREAAYESALIPMQGILADEVLFQLVSEFEADVFPFRFGFDLSKVRVLQEDRYRQMQRMDLGVRGGWIQVGEARREAGLEVSEADRIYIRPLNATEVPADGGLPRPLMPTRNGNGAVGAEDVADAVERRLDRRELVK